MNAFSQPSTIAIPYGGFKSENSHSNTLEYIQYFLYEVNYDIKIKSVTLQANLLPSSENCCHRGYFNIAFYDSHGDIILRQEDIYTDFNTMQKTGNLRMFKINLEDKISVTRGFYWIGLSRVNNIDNTNGNPIYNGCACFTSLNSVSFKSTGTNSMSLNGDVSKTKSYLLFHNYKNNRFPNHIPVDKTNIPCYELTRRVNNGTGLPTDTWFTTMSEIMGFPILQLN